MDTQHIEAINHRKGRSGRVYGENSRDMAEPTHLIRMSLEPSFEELNPSK